METVVNVKNMPKSGVDTCSQLYFTCAPLAPIIALAKSNDFKSLASYLCDLCGAHGYAQIVEDQGHLQIHLLFDSLEHRDSFKLDLEEDFKNQCNEKLTFDDVQTETDSNQSHLYPLRLNAFQSAAVLFHTGACNLKDAQRILSETKMHLDAKNALTPEDLVVNSNFNNTNIFVPNKNENADNHFFIPVVCSKFSLHSVWSYAKTCKRTFQFVSDNIDFWTIQARTQQTPLVLGIPLKLQVMRHFALEQAKFFESEIIRKCSDVSDIRAQIVNRRQAFDYYIASAKLGEKEAIELLETALKVQTCSKANERPLIGELSCTESGKLHLALGDYYANTNSALAKNHYDLAFALLIKGVTAGDSWAVLALYDWTNGKEPAEETHLFLHQLLLKKINGASRGDSSDIDWTLHVFSCDAKLPAFYKIMSEQALLAVLNGIKFMKLNENKLNEKINGHTTLALFAKHIAKYDPVRLLIETKVKKLLASPIEVDFQVSVSQGKIFIFPKHDRDFNQFGEAVNKSELAPFSAAVEYCGEGQQSIVLEEKSWKQFIAMISK